MEGSKWFSHLRLSWKIAAVTLVEIRQRACFVCWWNTNGWDFSGRPWRISRGKSCPSCTQQRGRQTCSWTQFAWGRRRHCLSAGVGPCGQMRMQNESWSRRTNGWYLQDCGWVSLDKLKKHLAEHLHEHHLVKQHHHAASTILLPDHLIKQIFMNHDEKPLSTRHSILILQKNHQHLLQLIPNFIPTKHIKS